MKRISTLLVVLLATVTLGACRGRPDPGPGEARLSSMSGQVETSRDGRTWSAARTGMLHRGDRVRARGAASRAVLDLHRGASVELRSGSQVLVRNPLRLVTGDLLVRAGGERLRVDAETATADVVEGGAARLTRSLAFDAGVYQGSALVTSVGRRVSIAALRQASVAGPGLVPTDAQPLHVRDDDRWDREFLGQWIDLGRDLQSRSTGLTGQLGGGGTTAGFYQLLLPDLAKQKDFTQALLDDASVPPTPGERLVGAAITVAGERGSFAERWREVFGFRSEGAEWGIVAADQHVRNAPHLVTTVDQALARAVAGPEVATAPGTAPSSTAAAVTPSATTPRGSSSPTTSRPSSPTTTLVPGAPPTTQPPVQPVVPTLPTLPPPGGTSPAPSSSPSPNQTATPVGQVTDTLVQTIGGILDPLQP